MHLAQNHHQRTQKTGEIGQTEVLILAFLRFSPYYGKKSEAYRGSDSKPEAILQQASAE